MARHGCQECRWSDLDTLVCSADAVLWILSSFPDRGALANFAAALRRRLQCRVCVFWRRLRRPPARTGRRPLIVACHIAACHKCTAQRCVIRQSGHHYTEQGPQDWRQESCMHDHPDNATPAVAGCCTGTAPPNGGARHQRQPHRAGGYLDCGHGRGAGCAAGRWSAASGRVRRAGDRIASDCTNR